MNKFYSTCLETIWNIAAKTMQIKENTKNNNNNRKKQNKQLTKLQTEHTWLIKALFAILYAKQHKTISKSILNLNKLSLSYQINMQLENIHIIDPTLEVLRNEIQSKQIRKDITNYQIDSLKEPNQTMYSQINNYGQ